MTHRSEPHVLTVITQSIYCKTVSLIENKDTLKLQKARKMFYDVDKADSSSTIHAITQVFKEYIDYANYLTSENSYKYASSKLESLNFIANDISNFANLISREHFTDKANYWTAGLFISAAVNKIIKKDERMIMSFGNLRHPVDCIGYKLVQGIITLQDNAGDYLGESMSGGEIIIQGNAGNYVGYAMSGGKIIIHGNVGDHIGSYMSGGIIQVEGQVGSIAKSCKGRIHHGSTSV